MALSAREAALKALIAYRKEGAWSELYLSELAKKEQLDKREAALAFRLTYGVLQNIYLCDFYISAYSSQKAKRLDAVVLDILRLSAYQILFLDKIPARAAVNEAVRLSKKYCIRASGFINAVLRALADNKDSLPAIPEKDFTEYLSVKYSHPVWLIKALDGRCDVQSVLRENNSEPPTVMQINTLVSDTASAESSLSSEGVRAERHRYFENCLEVSGGGAIDSLSAVKEGLVYVQDCAAKLSVIAAGVRPGSFVIDACAAPGGKSFAAAIEMQNSGRILSCDLYENKLHLIKEGAQRLKADIIETRCLDASVPCGELTGKADTVIADVPCSGMGIIRKKPDIRYKTDIEQLPELQLKILENVSSYVKPGGVLLYSTCTVLKSENEDVAEKFLSLHPDFSPEAFELPAPIGRCDAGYITLFPGQYGTDGFFICRLVRSE